VICLLYNKKIFIIVSIMIFLLAFSVTAVFAGGSDRVETSIFQ
jgi:hypothetical protein